MQDTVFKPGDKVLVLLPISGYSLHVISGPYLIKEKVGDSYYLVATPDRQRRTHLYHVNMLKSCCDRDQPEWVEEQMETGKGSVNYRLGLQKSIISVIE